MISSADEWEAARYAQHRLRQRMTPFAPHRGSLFGTLLALVVAVTVGAVGALRPGGAPAVLDDGTAAVLPDGRVYVLDDGTLYAAANLVSARLAASRVQEVDGIDLERYRLGPARGVPGALSALPEADALHEADWQLCDGASIPPSLTIGAAPYLPPPADDVIPITDGTTLWLVSGGSRLPVGADPAAADLQAAVLVSPALVSLLPVSSSAPSPTAQAFGTVVCAQSDPAAPFAVPSVAAIPRDHEPVGPSNNGIRVTLPAGGGLLIRQPDGDGYWLLSYTAELAPIADDAALSRLGYRSADAVELPGVLVEMLRAGPELSIEAARQPLT